ncbi:hypothetical protein AB0L53_52060 [Nonomuraea sp. NPDC052129]|jgi:hypothetical protein|uniref:hypothetical protein n=1 Tax=Nonomuraea TaxID=83681 RepID=UPI001CD9CDFA|nr:hypothetical protein [Nonomuraea aurantiaca]MCA2223299.1 hypothetical protein [Nonomuraea aurantiaca]
MDASDSRVVVLFIIVALALFVAGRRFQSMVSARQAWRHSMRAVPIRRQSTGSAVKVMLGVGVIVMIAFWFVTNLQSLT